MLYLVQDAAGKTCYRGTQLRRARAAFEALPNADFVAGSYRIAKRANGARVRMLPELVKAGAQ